MSHKLTLPQRKRGRPSKYPVELRDLAMTALTDPNKTFGEVSESFGIPESTLKSWAKSYPKEPAA